MNGDVEYDFETAVTSNLELKATWTATKYTITYDVGEGTNAEANPTEYTIESEDITLANPTGPEATPNFVAWHTSAKPAEGDWGDKVTGVAIVKGSTGNKAFYAEFSDKNVYTVSYYDGEKLLKEESVVEGAKAEAKNVEKEGYTFDKWYADAALTTAADLSKVTGNVSVYAGFKIVTYTVSFYSADGTEIPSQTVNHGAKATKPTTALGTRTGFTANGKWYVAGKEFDFDTATITADTKVVAGWKYDTDVVIETSKTTPTSLPKDGTRSDIVKTTLPDDLLLKAGDVVTIKLSGITDIAVENLSVQLICNAADTVTATQTSYGWIELSEKTLLKDAIAGKTDFDTTVDVVVIADANGTGASVHKVHLYADEAEASAKLYQKGTDLNNVYQSKTYTVSISDKTISIPKNQTYNYQASLTDIIPVATKLKATDVINLTIEGCFDVDVPGIDIQIIDASTGWVTLSAYTNVSGAIGAKTNFSVNKEITITADQVGSDAKAHTIAFIVPYAKDGEGNITNEKPTLYPKDHDFGSTKTDLDNTCDLTGIAAYDGLITVNVNDYVPANKNLSDYAFVKINVTFKDVDDNEVVYVKDSVATGQLVLLGEGNWTQIECISNLNPSTSDSCSYYCPLSIMTTEGATSLVKLALQNTGTNCASMTVNYIDYIPAIDPEIAGYYVNTEKAVAAIKANPEKTIVIGYTMTAEGKNGWGIGGLANDGYTCVNEINAPNSYEVDTLLAGTVAGSDVDDSAVRISLYNSALYHFAYIK